MVDIRKILKNAISRSEQSIYYLIFSAYFLQKCCFFAKQIEAKFLLKGENFPFIINNNVEKMQKKIMKQTLCDIYVNVLFLFFLKTTVWSMENHCLKMENHCLKYGKWSNYWLITRHYLLISNNKSFTFHRAKHLCRIFGLAWKI